MIDINLIPPHLRKQRKGRILGTINIPMEIIIGCGGGLLFLLGMIHVMLLVVNIGKLAHHKSLKYQWESLRSDKENVDSVVSKMRTFQGKYTALENIAKKAELSWAQKLNLLSEFLPRGMWFKKIALNNEMLFIEGSVVLQGANELASVSRLISMLKRSDEFMGDFTELELGSIQRRRIKNVDIADFVITMKLK